MNKKGTNNDREKVISRLRARLEKPGTTAISADKNITDQELGILLSELQVFQLELEMQNEELTASHSLLENEKSRFAGFFNLAPVGYFILDHLGKVEEANQTGADLLNIPRENILNQQFHSFIDPEAWEQFYHFLHKMQTSEDKHSCEVRLLFNNDRQRYTRMEGSAIYNAIIKKTQYYIAVIDITESRLARQRLIDTSQRLEMTLAGTGTGTWTMDLVNNSVFLDDFSYSLLEIDPWEFDGSINGFIHLVHPEEQAQTRQSLLSAINNFKEIALEFKIMSKNGNIRIMSVRGKEVHNPLVASYFAGVIMDITESKKIADESQKQENEKQRLILSAAFDAQEKERHKISSALHDSVCQILYGIRMNLQNIQVTRNLKDDFKNVNNLLDQAIRETRELSYELTPSVLRDFGFTAGVREMAQRFSTPAFHIKTDIKSSSEHLHQNIQLYLFRIIQELINNCIKHARASMAEIRISTTHGKITLVISDNGMGFKEEPEQAVLRGSGLRAIKNRIYLLNGQMQLDTSDEGTVITITFKNNDNFSELLG
ncbi:PAS domain-containing protein [Pedobacter ginsengisoli]|uniref:sensor histidine kinase n=1 Tax=Pedobacter ginsengisoli TaxID=363852 RepID=UPI00254BD18E|nr:PAS domain-containing protein [Pedobacter ginsengisoli]